MYNIKGFIRIESLVKNQVGQNSVIGEPSVLAMTYSREMGEYSTPSITGISLVSVSSFDDTGKVPAPKNITDSILAISKFVYDYASAKAGAINAVDFNADISTAFPDTIGTLNFGSLINNGNLSLPAFMSWTNPTLPANIIKIWFSDNSFRQQYDQFEIVVIPPIDNLDDFYKSLNVIKLTVSARSFPDIQDLIQAAKKGNPETVTRSSSYDYYNPLTGLPAIPTIWSVLIYGLAGDNIDSTKDAIVAYILANSVHTRAEWTVIFPELFKRTEFIILPRWENYAIPNLTVSPGIYSPIFNLKDSFGYAKAKIPGYPSAHVDTYLDGFGLTYKSLAALCIGSVDNRDSLFHLTDIFPDYIDESTMSIDFNRQGIKTQGFSSLLEHLVIVAETANDFNDIPSDVRRVKRGPTTFISAVYRNIQYLVATKFTGTQAPQPAPTTTPAPTLAPGSTPTPYGTPAPYGP